MCLTLILQHTKTYTYSYVFLCLCFVLGSWKRRERKSVHHIFPSIPSLAVGEAAQQRRGHSHAALDFCQVTPGRRINHKWSIALSCHDAHWVLFFGNHTWLHCAQALPYVGLFIAMIFFIYAVIGMQVRPSYLLKSRTKRNQSTK